MVSVAFSAGHHFGVNDIFEVMLVHKDVVNEVPMFGPRMHPGCFKSVLLLEDSVVMTSCSSVQSSSSKHLLLLQLPTPFLPSTSFQESASRPTLTLKSPRRQLWSSKQNLSFFCRFSSKSSSLHTEKQGIPLIFQRKAHGHHAVGMTSWQIFHPGGDGGADYETNTWKHLSVVGFPDQKRVYLAPCSWRLPSPGKQTLLRAAMSTFNLDSSCAIRAEWRSGWLLWAASSMVLIFQHATFSIFAIVEVYGYLLCFNVLGLLEKMPVDCSKPTGGWEMSFG